MSVRSSIAHAFTEQARWTAVSRVGGGPVARTTVGLLHRLMTTATLGQGIVRVAADESGGEAVSALSHCVSVRALCRRLAEGVPDCTSLRGCGLPVPVGDSPGDVNLSVTDVASVVDPNPAVSAVLSVDGRLVGGQLVACYSPLRCAWCSPRQWRISESVASRFSVAHVAAGGWFMHSALTVPHRLRDDLVDVYGWLMSAWGRVQRSAPLGRLRERVGVVACVPVFQCTFSPLYGWHPHLHVVWFASGDRSFADRFMSVLAEAWRDRVDGVSGRVSGIAGSDSVVVKSSAGLWRYLRPDDPEHPKNNCADPDHGGCWSCDPSGSGLLDGGDLTGGDLVGSAQGRPGLEVFSGLGPSAVAGNEFHQAKLAEYITVMARKRRIVSGFKQLRAVYGPLDEVDSPRLTVVDGERLWVSAKLFRQVELCAHRKARSLLHEGLREARDGSPFDAARLWELVLGVPVVAGFNADGDPLLRLGAEVEQVQGRLEIPTSEGVLV